MARRRPTTQSKPQREEIAVRLRDERERLGLSQADLATIAGVSRNAAAAWEKETSIASYELALLATHGFDVAYIVAGVRCRDRRAHAAGETGAMLQPPTRDEWMLLRDYRGLEPRQRRLIRSIVRLVHSGGE